MRSIFQKQILDLIQQSGDSGVSETDMYSKLDSDDLLFKEIQKNKSLKDKDTLIKRDLADLILQGLIKRKFIGSTYYYTLVKADKDLTDFKKAIFKNSAVAPSKKIESSSTPKLNISEPPILVRTTESTKSNDNSFAKNWKFLVGFIICIMWLLLFLTGIGFKLMKGNNYFWISFMLLVPVAFLILLSNKPIK